MCSAWALISILLLILGAPIPVATAAFLAVSLPATNDTVDQHKSISAVPYDPAPSSSSTPYTAPGDSITLESLNSSQSLPHHQNLTVDVQFHIPDSEIDLTFTTFGGRLIFTTAWEIVKQAMDIIFTDVVLHPTQPITGGVFQQWHEGLSLRVHQYLGKVMTWFLLNQVLLCVREYLTIQPQRLRDMKFEIDVEDEDRVGFGSLWSIGLTEGNDIAKQDVNETSQPLQMLSISKPAPTESNHSLLLPVPNERHIIFFYHFYGPEIPESLVEACFHLARQSIRTHLQTYPHDELPGSNFQYSTDGSDVSIEIHAYGNRKISWLLLDDLLREINFDLINERHLYACELDFETPPLEVPYGYGSLEYDPPDTLPANRSQFTATSVRKASRRLRDANDASNSPSDATTAILTPPVNR